MQTMDTKPTSHREHQPPAASLDQLVERVVESYQANPRTQHLDSTFLPSRAKAIKIIELLRRIMFPGFFDEQRLTTDNIKYHVGDMLSQLHGRLYEQIRQSLRYKENLDATDTKDVQEADKPGDNCDDCDKQAERLTLTFMERIVELRQTLMFDVQATFDGDPAADNTDETIFCYPGLDAIFIYRMAHVLADLKVPMLPRMMTEYAHNETGIDIHPGATIGKSFFIDHGTGVVIGETCIIGDRVKVYQGVTLGALSTRGGQSWKGSKRHPTIEDEVTIYGGAIVLGDITIGRNSTIGGSVFVTQSVPPGHLVTMKDPELHIREDKRAQRILEQRSSD